MLLMRATHGRAAVIATAALVASVGLAPTSPADVPLRPLEATRPVDPSEGASEHARSVQAAHEAAQRVWVAELQRQQDARQRAQARASRTRKAPVATGGGVWAALARCESGGDPTRVSASGRYRGAFQFSTATWRSVGETGDPAEASWERQLAAAQRLQARSGWGQWPACARKLGLL